MTAQAAQKNEATGTVDVEFHGMTFTIDREVAKDIDVLEAIEEQKIVAATKAVLGPEQWKRFRASTPTPNADTIGELFEALGQAVAGASAGE
jgi:hypothetical protein